MKFLEEGDLLEDKELLMKLFFILNGKNRIKIYLSLLNRIKTAKDIQKDLNISLPSVCRSLKEMSIEGVIKCLNRHHYLGKHYKLTSNTLKLRKIIEEKSRALNSEND